MITPLNISGSAGFFSPPPASGFFNSLVQDSPYPMMSNPLKERAGANAGKFHLSVGLCFSMFLHVWNLPAWRRGEGQFGSLAEWVPV